MSIIRGRWAGLAGVLLLIAAAPGIRGAELTGDPRPPANDDQLRSWLENMVWFHHFSEAEIAAATGLSSSEVQAAQQRLKIRAEDRPQRSATDTLLVLPYPGGRHPRIGFLDGAVRPQRETKLSVFTPWDPDSYVVVDLPEAVWSNLGLTYLAHTHVPTIWDKQQVALPRLEWERTSAGDFYLERTLPNGITFGSKARPAADHVEMEMWLTNGTDQRLSDLRVQICVMLKGAEGFDQQTNDNKYIAGAYVACHSPDKRRWIITAWQPLHRAWANPPCPCLHSDPKFPDCAPGQTQRVRGWLSFYEGTEIDDELARIEATGWRRPAADRDVQK